MELVTLPAAVLRLWAIMDRLTPVRNRRFAAARGFCAAAGALGPVKLQRNAAITAQGFLPGKLTWPGDQRTVFSRQDFLSFQSFFLLSPHPQLLLLGKGRE
jgi:hypothetical protein